MAIQTPIRNNHGITLLEVLISIGILAIGLIGTLSLIPAGGSYLRKAQVEGRAASLIPNAFNTMQNSGLFGENALIGQATIATIPKPSLIYGGTHPIQLVWILKTRAKPKYKVGMCVMTHLGFQDQPLTRHQKS